MPLWVKPSSPVETWSIMSAMRSHYEDTPLDFRADVGAQGFGLPYRWRPLTWQASDGRTYFNERSVGTQQTGFTLVAQIRPDMPPPLSALLHFGVDGKEEEQQSSGLLSLALGLDPPCPVCLWLGVVV